MKLKNKLIVNPRGKEKL